MHRATPQLDRGELIAVVGVTMARGPIRVVVNREHEGVTPQRALELGILSDVIFVRRDGWSLGAPTDLIDVAHDLWQKEWMAVINVQTKKWCEYDTGWKSIL